MSSSEITPGPWDWRFIGTMGQWALIGGEDEFVKVNGFPDAPLSADQRLIAAAPYLLGALQDAQRRLSQIANLANGESEAIYNLAYDGHARRALAKAVGV